MEYVSIIIPHRNRLEYLFETLNSIQCQTFRDWECLVVDDFSNISVYRKLVVGLKKYEKVKLIRNEKRLGANAARNKGLENAQGNYVMFVDSDDLLAEWCLQRRLECVRDFPECKMHIFPSLIFHENIYDAKILWNIFNEESDLARMLRADSIAHTSGVLWEKNYLMSIGGWDERLLCWQEWELLVRAFINNVKYMKYYVDPDTFVRRGEQNRISDQAMKAEMVISRIEMYNRIHDLIMLSEHNKNNVFINAAKSLYAIEYHKLLSCDYISVREMIIYIEETKWLGYRMRSCLFMNKIFVLAYKLSYLYRMRSFFGVRISRLPCLNKYLPNNNTFAKVNMNNSVFSGIKHTSSKAIM